MTGADRYQARSAALRETAKWMAAVFVGAGAVLFSGLSFANLSTLGQADNLAWIVGLASVPLVAAGFAVRSAARVIAVPPPGIEVLVPRFAQKRFHATADSAAAAGWRERFAKHPPPVVTREGSLEAFESRLDAAADNLERARQLADGSNDLARQKDADDALAEFERLQDDLAELVVCAEYLDVEKAFTVVKRVMVAAAVAAVLGVTLSGVVAAESRPQAEQGTPK